MQYAIGVGTIHLSLPALDGGSRTAVLNNVMHVPGLLQSSTTVNRLFSQRADHAVTTTESPTFIFSPTSSRIQYADFSIPLDHHAVRHLYTLHSKIHRQAISPDLAFASALPDTESTSHTIIDDAAISQETDLDDDDIPPLEPAEDHLKKIEVLADITEQYIHLERTRNLWHRRLAHISLARLSRLVLGYHDPNTVT